jgi:flavin reductase (DIM6/NTAB) family NADH-FMN oxidoreductase RutF
VGNPSWYRILYPRQVILVTSKSGEKTNIITLAWHTPVSFDPPLVAIFIGKTCFSNQLIKEGKEFVISIPTEDMGEKALLIGSKSGKEIDKFSEAKLTQLKSSKVKPPLIKECPISIECKLVKEVEAGDHTIFIGEVVEIHSSKTNKKFLFDKGGRNFVGF